MSRVVLLASRCFGPQIIPVSWIPDGPHKMDHTGNRGLTDWGPKTHLATIWRKREYMRV